MGWYDYKPYVPAAKRRAQAAREVEKRLKKGQTVSPVEITGREITSTFWGRAWCTNLESYSDFSNRLPRGRTYVRNGSVIDLKLEKGRINALVSGSAIYKIQIDIAPLPKPHWLDLKTQCAGRIGSLVELLQGKLSKGVMELVTHRERGLFPKPREITMRCSCPDYAGMCKHLAAVMYGIGHRLDTSPELLFLLRGVDHTELIEQAIPAASPETQRGAPTIAAEDLGAIFDIEIDAAPVAQASTAAPEKPASKKAAKKAPVTKKAPAKKVATTKVTKKAAATKVAKKAAAAKNAPAAKKAATVKKAPAAKKARASRGA